MQHYRSFSFIRSPANARKPPRRDGQTWGGHGWSDGPTDPSAGGKRVFQAPDGRKDEQPENIMPPAPKGGGIIKRHQTFGMNKQLHPHKSTNHSRINKHQHDLDVNDNWVSYHSDDLATLCQLKTIEIMIWTIINLQFHIHYMHIYIIYILCIVYNILYIIQKL